MNAATLERTELEETCAYWNQRSSSFGMDGTYLGAWADLIEEQLRGQNLLPDRVLDVGCGTGALALTLSQRGYAVTGADFSSGMLEQARSNARARRVNVRLVQGTVDGMPFAPWSFDLIVNRNVLSNVAQADEALAHWYDLLTPGGMLVYFDSAWWHYLYDARLDRLRAQYYGHGPSEHYAELERVARTMPISAQKRPQWDIAALRRVGFRVLEARDVSAQVWTREEQERYAFAPHFMLAARKPADDSVRAQAGSVERSATAGR